MSKMKVWNKNRNFFQPVKINSHYCMFTVNSEANARRIAMVEGCFGSSGQVWSIVMNSN
jgi:hypothetical protein